MNLEFAVPVFGNISKTSYRWNCFSILMLKFFFSIISHNFATQKVHAWMDYGGTYVFPHKHEDRKYIEISSKIIDRSMRSFMTRFLVMLGAFIIGMIRIFYANIFLKIKTTVIELKIPFIEANSDAEFAVNFVLQSLMLLYALLGYIGMEVAMELTILPGYATPKLVEHEFRKLDRKIEESCFDEMQVRLTFRNILLQMMDYDKYELISIELNASQFTIFFRYWSVL